jgi:hypothetical protein
MSATGLDPVVIASEQDLRSMGAYLLSGDRDQPVIALTWSAGTGQLVLTPGEIRTVVGSSVRIYIVTGKDSLHRLEGVLGRKLALPAGAARIWWPGLTVHSDPAEHPLVLQLEDERAADMLTEFARRFELSRPLVRREIKLIEDARALLERELAQAHEQQRKTDERLRDTQVERHEHATRADAAEARLGSITRERDALKSSIDIDQPHPKDSGEPRGEHD